MIIIYLDIKITIIKDHVSNTIRQLYLCDSNELFNIYYSFDKEQLNEQLKFMIRICFESLFILSLMSRLINNPIITNVCYNLLTSIGLPIIIQTYIYMNNIEKYYYVLSAIFITEHIYIDIMDYIIKCIQKTLLIILFFLMYF